MPDISESDQGHIWLAGGEGCHLTTIFIGESIVWWNHGGGADGVMLQKLSGVQKIASNPSSILTGCLLLDSNQCSHRESTPEM